MSSDGMDGALSEGHGRVSAYLAVIRCDKVVLAH